MVMSFLVSPIGLEKKNKLPINSYNFRNKKGWVLVIDRHFEGKHQYTYFYHFSCATQGNSILFSSNLVKNLLMLDLYTTTNWKLEIKMDEKQLTLMELEIALR